MVTWESKKKSCSIKWSNQEIGLQNSSIFNANLEFRNISIKKYKDKNLTSNEKWLDENVRQQVARLLLHKGGEKGHRDGHVDGCQYHQPVPNALEKAVVREYETRSLQRRRLVFGQRRRVVRQQRLRNQKYTNSNIIFLFDLKRFYSESDRCGPCWTSPCAPNRINIISNAINVCFGPIAGVQKADVGVFLHEGACAACSVVNVSRALSLSKPG